MPLKREHSVPSQDTTPARKVPRLTSAHIPSSPQPRPCSPTLVSPTETEHVPTPPSSMLVYAPQPVSHSLSLRGLDPAQLASRLEALTERYERGVDEVENDVICLRRQVSLARRHLETTPSFDEGEDKGSATPGVALYLGRSGSGTAYEEQATDGVDKDDGPQVSEDGELVSTLCMGVAIGVLVTRGGDDMEKGLVESDRGGGEKRHVEGERGQEPDADSDKGSTTGDGGRR
ncbi:hypothetical protein GSI_03095 [Ganoderma sinense ZZ0214-1]|uniref:Uncharacterized protein n=1 Tax=Ganoderma sinense ZZ0214-1 TaxID=1077348 RepID=A0A2G8SKP3_9APHY|nr:hypothetical protein GSI_03095 [Ganoderma sinense ZZ0214-1]